ncbi:DUF3558 domain-containing protein [Amycolatopsis sp. cmx-11-32]|uniref:DUF3558 domain-containing protein n=1 Tax=Amycolatopsis sp. cmx-11-32 TaxID=2785796 RepID=UPI0039E58CC5
MTQRTILVLGAAALVLTACSTPNDGNPTPSVGGTSSVPSSSAGQVPGPDVPKVSEPIDLARFRAAPCDALTSTQAQDLIGPKVEATPRNESAGPACVWVTPSTSRPSVNVVIGNGPDGGTAAVYAAKGGAYKIVEPLEPIEGYPVTAYEVLAKRVEGGCAVALGTSDDQTVTVAAEQSEHNIGKKDPCDAARQAAVSVLATLRAAK